MKISPRKVSKNKQPLSLVKLPKSKDISTIITPFPYSYYAKLSHKKYTDLFYCQKTCSNYCQNLTQKMTMSLLKMGQKTLSIIPDIRFNAV